MDGEGNAIPFNLEWHVSKAGTDSILQFVSLSLCCTFVCFSAITAALSDALLLQYQDHHLKKNPLPLLTDLLTIQYLI